MRVHVRHAHRVPRNRLRPLPQASLRVLLSSPGPGTWQAPKTGTAGLWSRRHAGLVLPQVRARGSGRVPEGTDGHAVDDQGRNLGVHSAYLLGVHRHSGTGAYQAPDEERLHGGGVNLDLVSPPPAWTERAACSAHYGDRWYPEHGHRAIHGKRTDRKSTRLN